MINGKFNVVLVLILVLAILTPNLVYAGNLTGPWSGSVSDNGRSAVVTSQAGNVTVTGVVTTSGNARWGVADSGVPGSAPFSNGKLNTNNFWSNSHAAGHTSLQSSYWWDISPDSVGTNIDRAGDDKGTGYITFYFSKPVLNPVLDLDRMGGDGRVSNKATTNSAILTLLNSDLSLTKLSGNSQFQVTSKTIERTPNQKFSQFNQEASWAANSAGAGSVMIKGIISSVSFKWTGTGIEGMGQDGIELVWDLTEYVDNTAPVVTSSLNRNMVRSGDNLTVDAQSSADTSYIVANVMGNLYSMNKGSGNNWNLDFTVPDAADGVYTVLLGAFDGMGNMGTSIMNFTVDNTAPTINATCNPVLTRTGNSVLVNATADDDTASMTLEVLGTIYNMIKDPTGTWIFNYTVPKLADGTYDIILTAMDALGNTGNNYLNFTVDNTAPTLLGDLNQTTSRTGDNITLNVSADNDTATLTATILGQVYNLTKGTDGFWTLNYTVPQVADGLYTIILTGTDALGNMGSASLNFTVDNTAPGINGYVLPGLTKTGNSVLVKVVSDPDTVRMTATILGTTYAMIQGPDGIWTLQYTVPQVMDGLLQVILDAWDGAGNHGFNTTNMSVDNALPGVNCTVLPGRTKNGGNVTLRVCADPDVVNITALITGNHYNLTQNSDDTWTLNYSVQGLADGFQTVLLTATNGLGSQGTAYTGFTVDNTAPTLKAEVLPVTVREGGKLFVRVYSDVDALVVTAEILGKTYNLIKGSNSIWTLTYTVPGLKDGNYNVLLRGWDDLNNTNNTTVAFKVQNPVTPVNHGSLGGASGSSTSTLHSGLYGGVSSSSLGSCGPMALSNVLFGLGISASVDEIVRFAGTTNVGTSFLGLIQAALKFGVSLSGVQLGVGGLHPLDIVLLNFNGVTHYSVVLQNLDGWVVLQDPVLGIRVLTKDQFNQIYTGYALILPPVSRGIPLTIDQMKNLIGGAGLEALYVGWGASMESSVEVPGWGWIVAALIALFGAVFFGGNYLLDKYAPNLIPQKRTGWKGLIQDIINLPWPILNSLKKGIPDYNIRLSDNFKEYQDKEGINGILGRIPTPRDIRDQIAKLMENWENLSKPYKMAGTFISLILSGFYLFKNVPARKRDVFIGGMVNSVKSTFKPIVKVSKPVVKIIKKEFNEYKHKGAVKYIKHKIQQVKKGYNQIKRYYAKNVKPLVKKYVKPKVHKYLDPIVKSKPYKMVRNVPVIKQGLNFVGKIGRKVGLW